MVDVVRFDDGEADADKDLLAEIEDEIGTELQEARIAKENQPTIRAAVVMRLNGASYADIARVLDYSTPADAKIAVARAIAESGGDLAEDRTALRAETNARLEFWLRSIAPKIITEGPSQLDFMSMGLRLTDRRIKLLGLDMPTQIELVDPDHAEFSTFVKSLVAKANLEPTPEGDPFAEVDDLEEGEDGVWRPRES